MISFVEGKIEYIFQDRIIINQNGIGFEIFVPQKIISVLNTSDDIRIYTYMSVKEDNISLFGFNSIDEREIFLKLITVSGVGPKNALAILDKLGVDKLINAIVKNDSTIIKSVPGIGDKLSKMICIDMASKINKLDIEVDINKLEKDDIIQSVKDEVITALMQLGFQKKNAEIMVNKVDLKEFNNNITSDKLLELALKNI